VTDEHARESSRRPTRETATGGASCVVLEYGWASPLLDAAGNLYGTTFYGGLHNRGTVFELTLNKGRWTERVLYDFSGPDGASPVGLIFDSTGHLYGTTNDGGAYGGGVVFELVPGRGKWTERVLHSFKNDGKDGFFPLAGVIFDRFGNLYGTTVEGGAYGLGAVFELARGNGKWTEKVLHSVGPDGDGGETLINALAITETGDLFGTSWKGGTHDDGSIFELVPEPHKWSERVLGNFNNGFGGGNPSSALVLDGAGNLYGAAASGSTYGFGTVFELLRENNWSEKVLHSFHSPRTDGIDPSGGLTLDKAGNLYGTTQLGGVHIGATVYKITP
jgi:uncharacterized repeat protein (TIGR03803 family)